MVWGKEGGDGMGLGRDGRKERMVWGKEGGDGMG